LSSTYQHRKRTLIVSPRPRRVCRGAPGTALAGHAMLHPLSHRARPRLMAVGVMLDRPGFGWHVLLSRLAGGQTFGEAIPNFGFSYDDLEAGFKR